jgi:hypothetical protein
MSLVCIAGAPGRQEFVLAVIQLVQMQIAPRCAAASIRFTATLVSL